MASVSAVSAIHQYSNIGTNQISLLSSSKEAAHKRLQEEGKKISFIFAVLVEQKYKLKQNCYG